MKVEVLLVHQTSWLLTLQNKIYLQGWEDRERAGKWKGLQKQFTVTRARRPECGNCDIWKRSLRFSKIQTPSVPLSFLWKLFSSSMKTDRLSGNMLLICTGNCLEWDIIKYVLRKYFWEQWTCTKVIDSQLRALHFSRFIYLYIYFKLNALLIRGHRCSLCWKPQRTLKSILTLLIEITWKIIVLKNA